MTIHPLPVPLTAWRKTATPPAEVSMPAHPRPGHTIVALHGDLDADSAPALRAHLLGVLHRSARLLLLDLGEVPLCDAAGLAVLIGTQRRATGLGITLRLVRPRPQTTMLLHSTGLARSLTVQRSATSPAITMARAC
ncbi:STAS domain-containing protein [Actinomadura sp. 21ATH]|uniref:STAS domain-containing protein n=1 Tax=Actinomadura sp. 21ATH TaxID=1735444 RepID=UPI0035C186DA